MRWVNFKSLEEKSLAKDFPDSTHVVWFNEGMPELLLNSAFPGLQEILKDHPSRRGTDKALHDMQRTSIARAVWMALIGDSLAAIKPGDDDEPPGWPDEDWQREVLETILRSIDSGKSDGELLRMAADEWRSHPGAAGSTRVPRQSSGTLLKRTRRYGVSRRTTDRRNNHDRVERAERGYPHVGARREFRNGSQPAIDYEAHVVDLGLGRKVSLDPLERRGGGGKESLFNEVERIRRVARPAGACDPAADPARGGRPPALGVFERSAFPDHVAITVAGSRRSEQCRPH